MRASLLVALSALLVVPPGCGTPTSVVPDAARTDGGASDAGAPDAGVLDGGASGDTGGALDAPTLDARADAGTPDAPLPACTGAPGDLTVVEGFTVELVTEGDPLVDPVGLTFGDDGALYVANSHSWLSAGALRGEILRFEDGSFTTFVDDPRLVGPGWVAFDADGVAYLGTEDADEAGGANDQLIIVDDGTVTDGPDASEVGRLDFGPGGAFGDDLYYTGRTSPVEVTPNPGVLLRWDPEGTAAPVALAILDGTTPVGAVSAFGWGHGGALGTDLYVGTVLDPGYTPTASVAIWRVTPTLAATVVAADVQAADLVASPDPGGVWGDFLYVLRFDVASGTIVRVSAAGVVEPIVDHLSRAGALRFGPDGALWFSDTGGSAIYRLLPCAP